MPECLDKVSYGICFPQCPTFISNLSAISKNIYKIVSRTDKSWYEEQQNTMQNVLLNIKDLQNIREYL